MVKDKISEIFEDKEKRTRALSKAIYKALLQHKKAGNPVVLWKDGKIIWIQPEDIPVEDKD
ncbi:MAG: hypothetical protein E3K38_12665 [Candidatus Kuenenia stuttgartiensis]|nr:hypothetical protein [Candidatus Kuenenia stuttgartiensis]